MSAGAGERTGGERRRWWKEKSRVGPAPIGRGFDEEAQSDLVAEEARACIAERRGSEWDVRAATEYDKRGGRDRSCAAQRDLHKPAGVTC